MDKINLDNITLVSVTSIRIESTIKALEYSCKNINFNKIKLFTNEDIKHEFIELVKIPKINYEQYSYFIVYELHKFIDTDFVLIIQDDGFIVNYDKWLSEFLEYDYIGAPWPLPNDNFSYRDINNNIIRVGNGGFSLRSKKLLELPSKLNLEWKEYFGNYNEDGFFACHNRHIFENLGCKFANIDIAKYFSHETNIAEINNIIPFGFHGKHKEYIKLI